VDIEESKNLIDSLPEKARELNTRLSEMLTEMNATYPSFNPHYIAKLDHKEKVPVVTAHNQNGQTVEFSYKEIGARVMEANLIYTTSGNQAPTEWFCEPAKLSPGRKVAVTLPAGTTHYFINLIDENNFLVSYPDLPEKTNRKNARTETLAAALKVK
jgi:hypothetical protein